MDREEAKETKQALLQAWRLHKQIIKDIRRLARMNLPLAYGCIRSAEVMLDMIFVASVRKAKEKSPDDRAGD